MNVTTGTRNTVYQRDGFACIHCGSMRNLELRQRTRIGNGGTENLVTFCAGCTIRAHDNQTFTDLGIAHGWKLRTWEEPLNREVYYQADGDWFTLTERGTRIRATETADHGR